MGGDKKWNGPIMTIILGNEIQGKSNRVAVCLFFFFPLVQILDIMQLVLSVCLR